MKYQSRANRDPLCSPLFAFAPLVPYDFPLLPNCPLVAKISFSNTYYWPVTRNAVEGIAAPDMIHCGAVITHSPAPLGCGRGPRLLHLLHVGVLELPLASSALITLAGAIPLHI